MKAGERGNKKNYGIEKKTEKVLQQSHVTDMNRQLAQWMLSRFRVLLDNITDEMKHQHCSKDGN